MKFLEKILGQRLLSSIGVFVIAIILTFSSEEWITVKGLLIFIAVMAFLFIIYEAKLRYFIKIKKSSKKFKSKKETFIASYFDKKRIKYIYERAVKVGKDTLHPDFYLPEFDVYVEYWGRWSNDFEYRKERRHKKLLYEKYHYSLIELFPDNLCSINQLDWKFTERLLKILKKGRS